ncbi:MAG: MBL fold metallo-hydrolase [Alphaproteobacteria bacterium]|nr:MBL fold metallo-hydrolase [Alphaproteobacteria bacterium]
MEMRYKTPLELFTDATAEIVEAYRAWMEPWAMCPESGKLIMPVQSYLVRTRHHTILIDTCVGCAKDNPHFEPWHRRDEASWLAALVAAGVAPEAVDFVLCTHFHADHCGWNTRRVDGRWVPTFPNASYVLSRDEVAHYAANPNNAYRESVLPVIEAGQAVLVDMDHALDDEVWLEPTPGHTPGHVAVRLASQGREAVMCGDLIHAPIQCVFPDWRFRIDSDPEQGRATRRHFLAAHCDSGRTVLTAHFPSPSMGHVVADGDAYRFAFL